jgi:ABC-type ATPase involved in cell division
MSVTRLHLKRLSAFNDIDLRFTPGINVLLGANSTGKTHVLKWLYGTLKTFEQPLEAGEEPVARLKQKLAGVFRPDERRVGRLVQRGVGIQKGELFVAGDEGEIGFTLSSRDQATHLKVAWTPLAPSVFMPSREALAMYEGFVAAYANRELSFDETYYDLCVALSASGLRGRRGDLASALMDPIERALGGEVTLVGERFYVRFEGETRPNLEAHLVAEGLRKVGSLARLIQNGSLLRQGLLLWDEPESSLNPRLIVAVSEILQALARDGVQIVLATHDYLLARRLSMMSERAIDRKEPPPVRFFLLSRADARAPVGLATGDVLADLPRTPMEEEFIRLYTDEQRAFAESEG